jgi:hypothetical protein
MRSQPVGAPAPCCSSAGTTRASRVPRTATSLPAPAATAAPSPPSAPWPAGPSTTACGAASRRPNDGHIGRRPRPREGNREGLVSPRGSAAPGPSREAALPPKNRPASVMPAPPPPDRLSRRPSPPRSPLTATSGPTTSLSQPHVGERGRLCAYLRPPKRSQNPPASTHTIHPNPSTIHPGLRAYPFVRRFRLHPPSATSRGGARRTSPDSTHETARPRWQVA